MIEVTRYIANDGKEFDKREDCIEYEIATKLHNAVKLISDYCWDTCCENCRFNKSKDDTVGCIFEQLPSSWEDHL